MREQCFLTAAVQNMKRLVKALFFAFSLFKQHKPPASRKNRGFVDGLTGEPIRLPGFFCVVQAFFSKEWPHFEHLTVTLPTPRGRRSFMWHSGQVK